MEAQPLPLQRTSHADTFARDNLPPLEQWPELRFDLPRLRYPARFNCAAELLDQNVARGFGDRAAIVTPQRRWTYAELLAEANRQLAEAIRRLAQAVDPDQKARAAGQAFS